MPDTEIAAAAGVPEITGPLVLAVSIGIVLLRIEGPFASLEAAEAHRARVPNAGNRSDYRPVSLQAPRTGTEGAKTAPASCPAVAILREGARVVAAEGPFPSVHAANMHIDRRRRESPGLEMESWPLTASAIAQMGRVA